MSSPNPASRAAVVSLVTGVVLMGIKMWAWRLTGSAALLSDALESLVNVAAAAVAVVALRVSAMPVDDNHPYGHGKVEQVSAAFEGGLVFAAGALIAWEGGRALLAPVSLRSADVGLLMSAGAAVVNALLGMWLLRQGKVLQSVALQADGKHVLSDVWTTLGVLMGLGLAWWTGQLWLDAFTALLVGLLLLWNGGQIFRRALDGLMDAHDTQFTARLLKAFEEVKPAGFRDLHRVRTVGSGNFIHVDAHVFVPANWTVDHAHDQLHVLEAALKRTAHFEGELALHLDPDAVET